MITLNTTDLWKHTLASPTAESGVVLVEADLPRLACPDEVGVGLPHVVELECEEALLLAVGRRGFAGVPQLVVSAAQRVLRRAAVVVLRGKLLLLAGLVVRLVRLHLTCETDEQHAPQTS